MSKVMLPMIEDILEHMRNPDVDPDFALVRDILETYLGNMIKDALSHDFDELQLSEYMLHHTKVVMDLLFDLEESLAKKYT